LGFRRVDTTNSPQKNAIEEEEEIFCEVAEEAVGLVLLWGGCSIAGEGASN
jgi:hypothetical protein